MSGRVINESERIMSWMSNNAETSICHKSFSNDNINSPIPAKPQSERPQELKCYTMRAHWLRLFENISIIVMESSSSWTKYEGHDKSSNSTAHVHRSTSCEVNHTRSPKRLLGECRKESIGTPESMGADRVDEPTQEDTVAKVRLGYRIECNE